jgi:acyl transferase domain-containing protein/acyl carrier protein
MRAAVVVGDRGDLRVRIDAVADEHPDPLALLGRRVEKRGVVFVFPGQGSQWLGMGKDLYATEPVFRDSIDGVARAIAPHVDWSLIEQMKATPEQSRLREIHVVQPMLFAIEVALAALWRSWGIEPDAVVGHSMGEVAAACVAGALTLEDAARVICLRSQLLRRVSGKGAMAAVELSLEDTARALVGYETRVSIAVSNSPHSTVISGDVDAIDELLATLQSRDVFCRPIKVDVASHSPQVDVLRHDLLLALNGIGPRAGVLPIYSTVTAEATTGAEFTPEYWAKNLRQPVLLSKAIKQLSNDGLLTFIEISPHPILLPAIESGLQVLQQDGLVLPSLRREEGERQALLSSVARLYVTGYAPDWVALNGPGAFVDVPRYQYQRERYWLEPSASRVSGGLVPSGSHAHPILSDHVDLADHPGARVWQFTLDRRRLRYLLDHRLEGTAVLPASVSMEIALAACAQLHGDGPIVIRNFDLLRPRTLSADAAPVLQVRVVPGDVGAELRIFAIEGGTPLLLVRADVGMTADQSQCPDEQPNEAPSISGDTFYADLESRGVEIGDGLRSVVSMSRSATAAIARLAVVEALSRDLTRYRCHPAIGDALFQLTAAALEGDQGLCVPVRLREVRWYRRPGTRATATVERIDPGGADRLVENLRLFDEGGTCLELVGVELQALERRSSTRIPTRVEDWLYQIEWRENTVEEQTTVKRQQRQEQWIVFADRTGVGEGIATWLRSKGQQVTTVTAANRYDHAAREQVDVRPDADEDYRALLDEICGREQACCRGVVFAWPLDVREPHDVASLTAAFDFTAAALRLVQALARHPWSQSPRVWFVTQGAQAIESAPRTSAQAPLWGLGRVVAEEHSDLFGGLVDLDPDAGLEAATAQLGSAIWMHGGEPEVGWRNGRRLVPRLVPSTTPDGRSHRWRSDATYVVSGAFGGVGLAVAREMVARGARRLILIGRSALPPRDAWSSVDPASQVGQRVAAVRGLESLGASIHLAAMDVADETAVNRYFDAFEREGWPSIRGVVHCAAITDDKLLISVDAESLSSVMRPKAIGAWVLDRRLRSSMLDWFVSFSSLGSLIGHAGQGSYAASNAFLDAFAARQRADGCRAVSINWAGWQGLGFAATNGGGRTIADLTSRGFSTFTAQQGVEALGLILARDVAEIAVVPADWTRFRASRVAANELRLVDELTLSDDASGETATAPTESFRTALFAAEPAIRREMLERHLQEHLAHVLRLPLSRLDPVTPLGSIGLESLMALEFRSRLEKTLGIKLSATLVWNHPTIRQLTTFLAGRLEMSLESSGASASVAETPVTATNTLVEISALSEDEALRALLGVQN